MSVTDHLSLEARSKKFGASEGEGIVRCDACPVLCRIRVGRAGACARYANEDGHLVRVDPVVVLERTVDGGGKVQLAGFLSFEQAHRAARTGRNPATGAEIQIPAATVPKVKVGKAFKDAVK